MFSRLLRKIPRSVHSALGRLIGRLWFDVFRIRRRVILENLRLAFPHWSEDEIVRTGRRAMENLGRSIADVLCLPFFDGEWLDLHIETEGAENLHKALAKGKGVICLGLHLGSGDFSIASLNYLGFKVHLITKSFKNRALNRFWFHVREKHGTRLIADRKSGFDILKALKKNEIVIFVLDQFMGPPLGVKTRFFGHETGTASGMALLVSRTQAPVVPCYSYFNERGKVVNVFESEIPFQDFGDRERTIVGMTQVYTDKIEEIVRRYPDQWMWVHRRWKEFKH